MKLLPIVSLVLFLALPARAQEFGVLADSVRIPVRILESINSDAADTVVAVPVRAEIAQALLSRDGKVLVAAGTPVDLRAVLRPSRGLGRPGSVRLVARSTTATDGQQMLLAGADTLRGRSYKARVWKLAAGTFAAAVIGGALILTSAKEDEAVSNEDAGGRRLAGGLLLGLSPLSGLWMLRAGQPVTIEAGRVFYGARPARGYSIALPNP